MLVSVVSVPPERSVVLTIPFRLVVLTVVLGATQHLVRRVSSVTADLVRLASVSLGIDVVMVRASRLAIPIVRNGRRTTLVRRVSSVTTALVRHVSVRQVHSAVTTPETRLRCVVLPVHSGMYKRVVVWATPVSTTVVVHKAGVRITKRQRQRTVTIKFVTRISVSLGIVSRPATVLRVRFVLTTHV